MTDDQNQKIMPNIPIKMNKLRTIIRLYEEQTGLKTISAMARTSRITVKKYIHKWNSLKMPYEEFQSKSDAELHDLFCVPGSMSQPNPRLEELECLMPDICKELEHKGATTLQQWDKYRKNYPDGYGLTQFQLAIQRYRLITNLQCGWNIQPGIKCLLTIQEINYGYIHMENRPGK
mgnify:CR=1 FL=1